MSAESTRSFLHHHELMCDSVTMAHIREPNRTTKHRLHDIAASITEENAELLLDASFGLAHLIAPILKIPGLANAKSIHTDIEAVREGFDGSMDIYAHIKNYSEDSEGLRDAKEANQEEADNKLLTLQKKRLANKRRMERYLAAIAAIATGLSVTHLVMEHAFHLAATTVFAPVAGFGLAIHQFAKGTQSAKAAWRARKKTDPVYLWLDRISKLKKAEAMITKFNHEGDSLSTSKWQIKKIAMPIKLKPFIN